MANRTDPLARQVHGLNPQGLVSRIIRRKVYGCNFWKEHCFAVSAESVIEPCVGLSYVGGTYGGKRQPAPFLCVVLKLLQLQPEEEVIVEFIKQERFKYLRAVGAFYFRLVGQAREVYVHLEPLLADYRKLRLRLADGKFKIVCMDEFIDDMLKKTAMLDVDLPVLPKRETLEEEGLLPPTRLSALEHDVEVYAGHHAAAAAGGGGGGAAAGEGGKRVIVFASEREQQLWLLQKQQLQQQQKTLQRHVQQQRMRLLQQQHEQQLLEQVKELELENDYNDASRPAAEERSKQETAAVAAKLHRPKVEEEGEGWWREGTRPHYRHRHHPSAGAGDLSAAAAAQHPSSRRFYYHGPGGSGPAAAAGGSRAGGGGSLRVAKGGSRSPTPVMRRATAEAAEAAAAVATGVYRGSQRGTRYTGADKSHRQHEHPRSVEDVQYDEGRAVLPGPWREGPAEAHRYRSGRGSRRTERRRGKEETQEQREEDEEDHVATRDKYNREKESGRHGGSKEEEEERLQRLRQQEERGRRTRRRGHGREEESAIEEEDDNAGGGDHGEDSKRKRRRSSDDATADTNGVVKEEMKDYRDKEKVCRSQKTKQRRGSTSRVGDGGEDMVPQEVEPAQQQGEQRWQQERSQQQQQQQRDEEEEEETDPGMKEAEKTKGSGRRHRSSREEEAEEERPKKAAREEEGEKTKVTGEERQVTDSDRPKKKTETQTSGAHEETGDRAHRTRAYEKEGDRRSAREDADRKEEERKKTTFGYAESREDEASRDVGRRVRGSTGAVRGSDRAAEGDEKDTRRRQGGGGNAENEPVDERYGRRRDVEEGRQRRGSVSSSENERGRRRRSLRHSEERETRRQQERREHQGKETAKVKSQNADERENGGQDSKRSDKRRRHSVSRSPARRPKDAGRSRRTAAEGSTGSKRAADLQQASKKMFEHPLSSNKKGGAGVARDKQLSVEEWDALRAELGLKPLK